MDTLILSCGTGGGHDSAANAILEAMLARGHHAQMLNPYALKSGRLANRINKTYIVTARNTPHAFGAVYKLGDLYRQLPVRSPVYFANRPMNSVLQSYIKEHPFDIVISTHLFPAEILTNMKRHGMRVPPMIFVATDYVCTPFTEETDCDAYVIPAGDLAPSFTGRGIPAEKLHPLGIPTRSEFAQCQTRDVVKQRLGLDLETKYVLITGGSMGGGKLEKAIASLRAHFANSQNVELIVVCGSNRTLYDKLKTYADPKLTIVGHTNDMASYMRASHLFITKPGGLSSTEAAVCGVPILHISPIPGCETYNAQYFSQRGMSISGEITDEFLNAMDELLNNEQASAEMVACQRRHINPAAATQICQLAETMVEHG